MRKILFLDRDGVINVNTEYLHKKEDLVWVKGVKAALALAYNEGYTLIVVTNQSGVARGYYTEDDVHILHTYMEEELSEVGARITAFYYCPHLVGAPVSTYDVDCHCRKPAPGMIIAALHDYPAQVSKSILIGDSQSDMEAAQAAGIRGYLFADGDMLDFMKDVLYKERCLDHE